MPRQRMPTPAGDVFVINPDQLIRRGVMWRHMDRAKRLHRFVDGHGGVLAAPLHYDATGGEHYAVEDMPSAADARLIVSALQPKSSHRLTPSPVHSVLRRFTRFAHHGLLQEL